jgi:hypothetical protein
MALLFLLTSGAAEEGNVAAAENQPKESTHASR